MKKFVRASEWDGKTIACVFIDEEELTLSFSDGTYGRLVAVLDDDDACINNREFNDSIHAFRHMHTLGIVTDTELAEAEQRYQTQLKKIAEEQRQQDIATLRRLLAKYPEVLGGEA